MKRSDKSAKLDQLGMTASLACAIHCAVLPFLITTLPLWGLGFLAHNWVELTMLCLSLVVGAYSLSTSYPKHKKALPVIVLVAGFTLIGTGHYLIESLEAPLIALGGFSVAVAHFINWRYNSNYPHKGHTR